VIVHIDERTARRWLAGVVAALTAAHLVAVGADLRGADVLDLRTRDAVARWVVVALLLGAAGLAALLARAPFPAPERSRWRLIGWFATLASVDAVVSVGPSSSVGWRIAEQRWWAVAAAVLAVAVVLASLFVQVDRRRARVAAVSVAGYLAGMIVGAEATGGSFVGRLGALVGAAGLALAAIGRTTHLDGAEARDQVRELTGVVTARMAAAPGEDRSSVR
jgi:hypothetical protein